MSVARRIAVEFWRQAVVGPWRTFSAILAVGLVVTGLLTRVVAGLWDAVVESEGIEGVDRPVLERMLTLRTPGLDTWVTHFTDLGGARVMPVLATVAAVAIAWWWRSWTPLLLVAVAGFGGVLLTRIGKDAVGRARPPVVDAVPPLETSFSFPSGHTLNATTVAGIVAYLVLLRVRRLWARVLVVALAAIFALAMGLSRVYLGHHWLTDVMVGWALGLAWITVVVTGHRLLVDVARRRWGSAARPSTPGSDPLPGPDPA